LAEARHAEDEAINEILDKAETFAGLNHREIAVLLTTEKPEHIKRIFSIYGMKFENGEIRRINVNITATTVEKYRKLKDIGIGTYILFCAQDLSGYGDEHGGLPSSGGRCGF
jgi:2-iminoacetate synthase ThiH